MFPKEPVFRKKRSSRNGFSGRSVHNADAPHGRAAWCIALLGLGENFLRLFYSRVMSTSSSSASTFMSSPVSPFASISSRAGPMSAAEMSVLPSL